MLAHFQHGGHEPEVVISRHLAEPCKELFIASAHDVSDGMYVMEKTGSSFI